ncbi:MAG: AraC family transcriptional regulator, partial [Ferruginibacter sp.]|nr:AraC family transcriptional regulator [Chitinophagaceae bacterium]
MKHITIIVPDGQSNVSTIACIVGAYEIFTRANGYRSQNLAGKQPGKKKLFTIQLAGVSKKAEFDNGLFTVKPQAHISAITKTDLIIIPSLVKDYQKAMKG